MSAIKGGFTSNSMPTAGWSWMPRPSAGKSTTGSAKPAVCTFSLGPTPDLRRSAGVLRAPAASTTRARFPTLRLQGWPPGPVPTIRLTRFPPSRPRLASPAVAPTNSRRSTWACVWSFTRPPGRASVGARRVAAAPSRTPFRMLKWYMPAPTRWPGTLKSSEMGWPRLAAVSRNFSPSMSRWMGGETAVGPPTAWMSESLRGPIKCSSSR
mmetsp:Transcript_33539/g.75845  ORF Transcript_33539/g.75845 Transcript_33539/m.75845 type:complete len:210 (-) Transcript_33539:713-1342(-)